MKCANHPDTMTGITCSQCDKPICPGCQVETEAGILCRQCDNKNWRSKIDQGKLLKIAAYGLGAALVCGILWGLLDTLIGVVPRTYILKGVGFLGSLIGFIFTLVPAIGASHAIGTVISIRTGAEYGWQIVLFTSLGVLLSYAIATLLARYPFDHIHSIRFYADLAALAMSLLMTYKRLHWAEI